MFISISTDCFLGYIIHIGALQCSGDCGALNFRHGLELHFSSDSLNNILMNYACRCKVFKLGQGTLKLLDSLLFILCQLAGGGLLKPSRGVVKRSCAWNSGDMRGY